MARPLSVSLQDYAVDWQRSPWPVPWAAVFGRSAPLALEIGFGNGAFLAEQAELHPERDHIGLELSWTAATHIFRRLQRAGLTNVRVVTGDVEALLQRLFAPGSLAEVFVNHPCPWPKARHVQRRLLARPFLERLAERMQTGARLSVVTDHAGYAAWLAGELESQRSLASCHATSEVAELPGRTPTKYQLKAMAAGIPIHYFEWRKVVPGPAWTGAPVEPRALMPTLTLAGSFDPAALFADFRPRLFREQHQGVEIAVRLESVFHRLEAPHWLVQALAQEDRLRQHFGIEVVERGGDALLLKLSEIGLPYPTHGVRRALWLVGEELRARFPELRVRHESLGLG